MVSTPDFASRFIELKKRSDFYVGPFWLIGQKVCVKTLVTLDIY